MNSRGFDTGLEIPDGFSDVDIETADFIFLKNTAGVVIIKIVYRVC